VEAIAGLLVAVIVPLWAKFITEVIIVKLEVAAML
jgi:hypothetical protein